MRELTLSVGLLVVSLVIRCGAEEPLQFNRDIRPILFENCISCHGPDSASRKADLRLDKLEIAVSTGAIVPGDLSASELLRRIDATDEAERMPPVETKKKLTAKQKELLTRWIQEGAEYQPHWSLIAAVRPDLPETKNAWWVRNPIDRFVAKRLEQDGLTPAPEAAWQTLIRRVSLDLTGLPPTPELIAEFGDDTSPGAYENLVDRLLESPHWGEHRGRAWLDVARYGDTHGIHIDNYREMWTYRDWVIEAFNQNMPFDQFTIENLAGDLLPAATAKQKTGSGFNRCNITTNEGGVIKEEYAVLYTRDRTETTAIAWLGLTAGCAVCHDHKFDPISQREFYELAAFFNNTTQDAMDGNSKDTPPVVVIPQEKDQARWNDLESLRTQARVQLESRRQTARREFDSWVATAKLGELIEELPQEGLHFFAPLDDADRQIRYRVNGDSRKAQAPTSLEWRDGPTNKQAAFLSHGDILEVSDVGDFEKDQPWSVSLWLKLPGHNLSGAILARIDEGIGVRGWDLFVNERYIGSNFIHKWPQNALKVFTKKQIPADTWTHVTVRYDGSMKASGYSIFVNGLSQELDVQADSLVENKSTRNSVPFRIGRRHRESPVSDVSLADLRIYDRKLSDGEVTSLASQVLFTVLDKPAAERKPADLDGLFDWWLGNRDRRYQRIVADRESLEREVEQIKARSTVAHVMQEAETTPQAYLLVRGEYDQRGDAVQADTPDVLPAFPEEFPRNRLGLAMWLLEPNQPLTARVAVNRFWQEVFGTGLVKTSGDFGVSGELPSHPELLDWLAVEFRETDWDVKRLFKLIVMSATYRQSAVSTPEKLTLDPDNRLLARGPRFRMEAEMVRDYSLAASGLLVKTIGGASVKPYQPPGVWEAVAMPESNTHTYKQDSGNALYRRSMYTFWKRSAPPASLDIFNAPTRERCVTLRERTNTPLQALVTLNDPQYVESARYLAEQTILTAGKEPQDRIQWIAERILGRQFRAEELAIVQDSLDRLAKHYQAHAAEAEKLIAVGEFPRNKAVSPVELATWTMTVNELLNLDEVLCK